MMGAEWEGPIPDAAIAAGATPESYARGIARARIIARARHLAEAARRARLADRDGVIR